jgi:hypothetical protein
MSGELHVSSATITRDITAIKKEIASTFNSDALDDIVPDALIQIDEIIKQSWMLFNQSKNESNRLGSLNTVQRSVATKIDILERFGLDYIVTDGVKTLRRKNYGGNIGDRLMAGLKLAMQLNDESQQLIQEGKLKEEDEETWQNKRAEEILADKKY